MRKLLFLLFILGFACSEDEPGNRDPKVILTISVESNTIEDGDRRFYMIKGENGQDLEFGELNNSDELILSNKSYKGSLLSVTLFYYNESSDGFSAVSYLDIPVGKDLVLKTAFLNGPSTARLSFENKDTSVEWIRIAKPGGFKSSNHNYPANGDKFNFSFFEEAPLLVVTTDYTDERLSYQTFQLNEEDDFIIDMDNNVPLENTNSITSKLTEIGNNFAYRVSLDGLIDNGPDIENDYPLYIHGLSLQGSQLTVKSPSYFNEFRTVLVAQFDNTTYSQATKSVIPDQFDYIDPEFSYSTDFTQYEASTKGSDFVTYISTFWSNNALQNKVNWAVLGPSEISGNYRIHEIPEDLNSKFPKSYELHSFVIRGISATNDDNKVWETLIDSFFGKTLYLFETDSEKLFKKSVSF